MSPFIIIGINQLFDKENTEKEKTKQKKTNNLNNSFQVSQIK